MEAAQLWLYAGHVEKITHKQKEAKMKIILVERNTKEILDFERERGLELVVTECETVFPGLRFYARFEQSEVRDGGVLVGVSGSGATVNDAIGDYARKVSHQLLVINAYNSTKRREIKAPKLVHTKTVQEPL